MRIVTAIAIVTLGSLAATPAAARDGRPAWQGFHVEGLAGTKVASKDDGGFVYGLGAGYDFQSGRAVFGVDAEATNPTNSLCATNAIVIGDRICAKSRRELSIGLRGGILLGRNMLLYAKAGYTNARFDVTYDDGTSAGTNDFRFHETLDGLRLGGGAELRVSGNAFFRLEGRYSSYKQGSDRGQVVAAFGFRF